MEGFIRMESSLFYKAAPRSSAGGQLQPALIFLHGRGTDEQDLLGLEPYVDPRFSVFSVRAPYAYPFGGYSWFELDDASGAIDGEGFRKSHDQLIAFINQLPEKYPVDPARIYLYGFSQGAILSYAAVLTHPEHIRGIVAHSGFIPEDVGLKYRWDALAQTSMFIAHGIEDPVLSIEFARRAQRLLAPTGVPLEYHEYPIPHTISEESLGDSMRWLYQQLG
jgi:phospholipase/carboxylesterase